MQTTSLALILAASLAIVLAPAAEELRVYPELRGRIQSQQELLSAREQTGYEGIYKLVAHGGRNCPLVQIDRAEDLLALVKDLKRGWR